MVRYPSTQRDPRELRPRSANRIAAFALVVGLIVVIAALVIFA